MSYTTVIDASRYTNVIMLTKLKKPEEKKEDTPCVDTSQESSKSGSPGSSMNDPPDSSE